MDTKKVEEKVENKPPLKVEDKKLSKEELKSTIGGGSCYFFFANGLTWGGGGS